MPNGWGDFGTEAAFDDATTYNELWDRLIDNAIGEGLVDPDSKFDPHSEFNESWASLIIDEDGSVKDHPDRPQQGGENWHEYADFLDEWDGWDVDRDEWPDT